MITFISFLFFPANFAERSELFWAAVYISYVG